MCTALNLNTKYHYFGRTLDLDFSYNEEVCIIPRNYPFEFRHKEKMINHYAIIGMATIIDDVPLLYDGANEYGLAMAGLNFPGNAFYYPFNSDKDNITPFEFIPWILGSCKTVKDAKLLLSDINLINEKFNDNVPLSPLHWIISDSKESIVVESMKDGLHIHNNKIGVMTNNPPFEYQLFNLNNYRNIQTKNGNNSFSNNIELNEYCQGLGGIGLPGDVSSMSRFVRIAFAKENSKCNEDEHSSVSQFFHLLSYVEMPRGICIVPSGHYDITIYTSCINTDLGIYYYTTYDNHQINAINMHNVDLDTNEFISFKLNTEQNIKYNN